MSKARNAWLLRNLRHEINITVLPEKVQKLGHGFLTGTGICCIPIQVLVGVTSIPSGSLEPVRD